MLSCCSERYEAYFLIAERQWPIVYSPAYNIRFGGLENLHPFDSKKWGRVYEILVGMYLSISSYTVATVDAVLSWLLTAKCLP